MSDIKNEKIEEFLDNLGSASPTPGGGAVAALTGAMAASLVKMVVSLSKTNSALLKPCGIRAQSLKVELLELADEDCRAFDGVLAAYRSKDKEVIGKSLQKAINVPKKTVLLSNEVLKLAKVVLKKGNKNTYSDAKSAIYLAQAAIKSADENIKINQQSLAVLT